MANNSWTSAAAGLRTLSEKPKVHWYTNWNPELDEALAVLPEMPDCPHELYKALAINPGPAKKRIALVTRGHEPVSVVALRKRGHRWEPVTVGTTPGAVIPTVADSPYEVLKSLRVPIWVLARESPVDRNLVTSVCPIPEFRACLADNFEQYWRDRHLHKTIRRARNAFSKSEIRIDGEGDSEWAISMAEEYWTSQNSRRTVIHNTDRLLAAAYFRPLRRYRSLCLIDQGDRIACYIFFVRGKELISEVTYRHRAVHASPGTRVLDHAFHWARDEGYKYMNLTGGHSYKADWAPLCSSSYNVYLDPLLFNTAHRIRQSQQYYLSRITSLLTRLKTLSITSAD